MSTLLAGRTVGPTIARELLSYRINRFLHLHAALMLAIGCLALIAPPEAAAPGTAWWVLNGVIYVASLSALLLGLSSAQAETDEFAILFTHPITVRAWVWGKCIGLLVAIVPAALLLVLPTILSSGLSVVLLGAAASAAAVSVLLSWIGLAIGLYVHDPVRGLITALSAWCLLLFGMDLVLILVGGSPWVHAHPALWVGALMLNPLDAYRISVLFVVERAAFSGGNLNPITQWWLEHPRGWLAICVTLWCAVAFAVARFGASRRRSN